MRRLTVVLVCVAALLAPIPGVASANPSADPPTQPGVALPGIDRHGPLPTTLSSATNSLVAYRYAQPRGIERAALDAHRLTDGSVAGTLTPAGDVEYGWDYLPDDRLLVDGVGTDRVVHLDREASQRVVAVDTRTVEGVALDRITVPEGDELVGSGAGWALTKRPVPEEYNLFTLRVLTAEGVDRPLVGGSAHNDFVVHAQLGDRVFMSLAGVLSEVDVLTATATAVADPSEGFHAEVDRLPIRAMTEDSIWWAWFDAYTSPAPAWVVERLDRATRMRTSIRLADEVTELLPLGSGLAAIVPGDGTARPTLRTLDPTSGQVGATLLEEVVDVVGTPGSHVVAVVADDSTGHLVEVTSAQPGATRTIAALPQLRVGFRSVDVSGDRVLAEVDADPADPAEPGTPEYTRPVFSLSGDRTTWQRSDLRHAAEGVDGLVVGGDLTLSKPVKNWGGGRMTWRLSWPGGSRDLGSWFRTPVVGVGGRLVARLLDNGSQATEWAVEEPRTGEVLARVPANSRVFIDQGWVWSFPYRGAALTGLDVVGGAASRTVALPAGCTDVLAVRGRFAKVICPGTQMVLDLFGSRPPEDVTSDHVTFLADDAFVVLRPSPDEDTLSVCVRSLHGASEARCYGPAVANYDVGLAGDGGPRLTYLDDHWQPRLVDLSWLPPASPDVTAPTTSTSGTGPTATTRSVSRTWSATDPATGGVSPSGVASFDVRVSDVPRGTAVRWTQPAALQATTARSTTLTSAPGRTVCTAVRARDAAGNVGAWSADRCSTVDYTAPTMTSVRLNARPLTGGAAVLSWAAADTSGIASYDVQMKAAAPGRAFGAWTAPRAWQATKARSVSTGLARGVEACFLVRARDLAGNVSAWGPVVCTVQAFDDRDLVAGSGATRGANSAYAYGSWTKLGRSGAQISRTGQLGTRAAFVALRGPGQGVVDVYLGSRRLGRVSLAASSWSRTPVWLPVGPTSSGTLRVVSVSSRPVIVDAVAVSRY